MPLLSPSTKYLPSGILSYPKLLNEKSFVTSLSYSSLTNLGYDKKDVEKFEQIEEITEVEPVYNYDVLTTINDKNLPVRIISKTKDQKIRLF